MAVTPLSPKSHAATISSWEQRFFRRLDGLRVKVSVEPYERSVAQGMTMAYRLTPEGDVKGRIVFAHATGNDCLFPQVELFLVWLEAGFEIFTFDLDGHGARSTSILSTKSAASIIPQAVNKACANVPALPLFGVGQSLGAALWLKAMSETSLPVRSLILYSAPIKINISLESALSELGGIFSGEFWRQRIFYGLKDTIPPMGPWRRSTYPIRMRGMLDETSQDRVGSTHYPHHIARLIHTLAIASVAPKVAIPTLLIYGKRDRIVTLDQGQKLQSLLPTGRLTEIPEATHYTVPFSSLALLESAAWLLKRS